MFSAIFVSFFFFFVVVDFKQKKILRRCNSWVVGFFTFFLQIPQRKHHYLSYISVKLICHSLTLLFRSFQRCGEGGQVVGWEIIPAFKRLTTKGNEWVKKALVGGSMSSSGTKNLVRDAWYDWHQRRTDSWVKLSSWDMIFSLEVPNNDMHTHTKTLPGN